MLLAVIQIHTVSRSTNSRYSTQRVAVMTRAVACASVAWVSPLGLQLSELGAIPTATAICAAILRCVYMEARWGTIDRQLGCSLVFPRGIKILLR